MHDHARNPGKGNLVIPLVEITNHKSQKTKHRTQNAKHRTQMTNDTSTKHSDIQKFVILNARLNEVIREGSEGTNYE